MIMTPHLQRRSAIAPRRQQGIALIMAIILLIIATLTGLAGMRNTSLQEKLSGNLYDRAIAMQAAEHALGQAERWLFTTGNNDVIATSTVINCEVTEDCPAVPASTFTSNSTNWVTVDLPTTFNADLNAASSPQYYIQFLGLKTTAAITDTDRSMNSHQYGITGGGTNRQADAPRNALYRVTVRSSTPTADNDRSIVVLSSLVKGS